MPSTARRIAVQLLLALPVVAAHAGRPAAAAAEPDPSMGAHGMVLFGGRAGLYASHLPMFHPPHAVQAVLRVHFADPRLDAAVRARLDGKAALWTLDPERFALSRLAPGAAQPLAAFRADVVEGHFEQGGAVRYRAAGLVVDEVLVYRPLAGTAPPPPDATYLPVGRFLVKRIDGRPDVDHIVRLRRPAAAPVTVARTGGLPDMAALARRVPLDGTVYESGEDLR
jgi:hypothetical protein